MSPTTRRKSPETWSLALQRRRNRVMMLLNDHQASQRTHGRRGRGAACVRACARARARGRNPRQVRVTRITPSTHLASEERSRRGVLPSGARLLGRSHAARPHARPPAPLDRPPDAAWPHRLLQLPRAPGIGGVTHCAPAARDARFQPDRGPTCAQRHPSRQRGAARRHSLTPPPPAVAAAPHPPHHPPPTRPPGPVQATISGDVVR